MSQNTLVTHCPGCGQRLRFPQDQARLVLTCPRCRHRWDWVVEERLVRFHCAITSEAFHVLFRRLPGEPKLRVSEITASEFGDGVTALPDGTGRIQIAGADGRTASVPMVPVAPEDFDFTGWACAHCGFAGDGRTLFVLCGQCGSLTCGARVRHIDGGASTFLCHDRCGCSSTLGPPMVSMPTVARPQRAAEEGGGTSGLPAVLPTGVTRADDGPS